MKAVVPYLKRRGETPKEALDRLRVERPEFADEKLSYAGRLDPLAEGLLLILVGDANKDRENYLSLSKKYRLGVLFGWSTDTYDVAGKLVETSDERISAMELIREVTAIPGVYTKPYPPYSSKPVLGKPLHVWAREGKLSQITIPTHRVEIKKAELLKIGSIKSSGLEDYVYQSIDLISGDFRQDEIRACWENNLKGTYRNSYDTAIIEISCESGAYMREIAKELGERLCIPALALSIFREQVGDYTLRLDSEGK